GPSEVDRIGSGSVGGADGAPALDASAGEDSGLLQEVIAPAGSAERTDGAAKLADHDDKRLVQKPAGFHVAQHRSDAVVERLAHGVQVIAARILRAVNVLMHVP